MDNQVRTKRIPTDGHSYLELLYPAIWGGEPFDGYVMVTIGSTQGDDPARTVFVPAKEFMDAVKGGGGVFTDL